MEKCGQRTLHEKYGLSLNINEMDSAKSLVRVFHTLDRRTAKFSLQQSVYTTSSL
jgi:hypothetical protein